MWLYEIRIVNMLDQVFVAYLCDLVVYEDGSTSVCHAVFDDRLNKYTA